MDADILRNLERPTLFETAASERVVPALISALEHAITVIASRHPYRPILRLHAYREEAIAILLLLVERQCLESSDGTIAESLFGLRRAKLGGKGLLTERERMFALLLHVGVSYVQRKLERMCLPEIEEGDNLGEGQMDDGADQTEAGRDERLRQDAFSIPTEARGWALFQGFRASILPQRALASRDSSWLSTWKATVRAIYPWIHAFKEAGVLATHILYLFDRTPFSSPWLWLLGQHLRRLEQNDAQKLANRQENSRKAQFDFAQRQWGPIRLFISMLLKGWHALNDRSKMFVLGAALLIKLADWWFSNQQGGDVQQDTLPVPPPPSRPAQSNRGIPVPSSRRLCAICGKLRTNPTASSSGFVFCYPCIFRHVEKEGTCPVTLMPCNQQQLRRIYESS